MKKIIAVSLFLLSLPIFGMEPKTVLDNKTAAKRREIDTELASGINFLCEQRCSKFDDFDRWARCKYRCVDQFYPRNSQPHTNHLKFYIGRCSERCKQTQDPDQCMKDKLSKYAQRNYKDTK